MSEQRFYSSLTKVCGLLQKNSVEYLLIGGSAVAIHGRYRLSSNPTGTILPKDDIDIWYNPTLTNHDSLLKVLEELGVDIAKEKRAVFNPNKSFFKIEFESFYLDCLCQIKGDLKFHEAYSQRNISTVNGVEISVISFEDLKKNKSATGRTKDIDDIDNLNSEIG